LAATYPPIEKLHIPTVSWAAIAPFLLLTGGAIVLLVGGSLLRGPVARRLYGPFAALVALAAGISGIPQWHKVQDHGAFVTLAGAVGIDGFSLFATFTICAALFLSVLFIDGYLVREELVGVEPYVLLMLSAAGALVMASANDLMVMFLGLEIMSIAVYVLAGIHTRRSRSGEAALKYFILGGLSSAFFLYGIALLYGATGSTHLATIADFLAAHALTNDLLLIGGIMLLLVGFGFKVAAVPFHNWTPDVYQGSPTPVSGFMASAVKVGGFVGLLRVFLLAFDTYRLDWQPVIYVLAILTLVVGAVLAVVQTDVKRLLAYSSISHAGFVLVAVEQASHSGTSAALFYLAGYSFMVLGSFGVVGIFGRRGDGHHSLADYTGVAAREPALAFVLTVFLLAQAGVPLTVGFVAKFEVIMSAVEGGSWPLALIAMVSAVISAFLYLKIVIAMYVSDETADESAPRPARLAVPWGTKLGLGLAFVFVVGVGIIPGPITNLAHHAVPHIIAVTR
jgi:NADH-quinone oxidoreductase subunit N